MSGIFEGHDLLPLFQIQNTWDLKVIHNLFSKYMYLLIVINLLILESVLGKHSSLLFCFVGSQLY